MQTKPTIVVLGDYERCLERYANWASIQERSHLKFFHDPLQGEQLFEVVKDAQAIALVRDRSTFNAELITKIGRAHV